MDIQKALISDLCVTIGHVSFCVQTSLPLDFGNGTRYIEAMNKCKMSGRECEYMHPETKLILHSVTLGARKAGGNGKRESILLAIGRLTKSVSILLGTDIYLVVLTVMQSGLSSLLTAATLLCFTCNESYVLGLHY